MAKPETRANETRNSRNKKAVEVPLDSNQKMDWAEYQIRQVVVGRMESVACPFCLSNVILGEDKLCCGSMIAAATTVLRRMETEGLAETDGLRVYPGEPQSISDPVGVRMKLNASRSIQ